MLANEKSSSLFFNGGVDEMCGWVRSVAGRDVPLMHSEQLPTEPKFEAFSETSKFQLQLQTRGEFGTLRGIFTAITTLLCCVDMRTLAEMKPNTTHHDRVSGGRFIRHIHNRVRNAALMSDLISRSACLTRAPHAAVPLLSHLLFSTVSCFGCT